MPDAPNIGELYAAVSGAKPAPRKLQPGDKVRVLGKVTHVEGNAIAVHFPGNIGTTIVHRQHVKAEERGDA